MDLIRSRLFWKQFIPLISILGFVCTSTERTVPFDIVRRADRALYEAKNGGRNAVRQG